jgi:hypothetical protein
MTTRSTRTVAAIWLAAVVSVAIVCPAARVSAQTPYVPYYGKNIVRYDRFDWHIYKTDHFEIYYYTGVDEHLERIAGYAESAYQQISADLKHDLAFKIPLIVFKTHSEFEQENVIPGAAQEGVGAFAEPTRNRMLLPLDSPPDLLYHLIVHELTHIFEFDIIPQSLVRQSTPLWVAEGLSDYMTGLWRPIDLMTVRDAAIADIIPKMSKLEGYGDSNNPRLVYNLGHAAFEFIESKWGKEGMRQFLFSMRKNVIGGGDSAFQTAFQMDGDDFDQAFDRYLKARFKPFRDKETPADYGKNLAPKPERTSFLDAFSVEPSPSGDLLATATVNRKDREMDIVLISAKDGKVIRNLTPGFDQGMGFDYIVTPGERWVTIPWMSWAPAGDRLAYVVRKEKFKAIVIQNVLTRKIEKRIELKTVDEPESPAFSPDGKTIAFAALQNGVGDIFTVEIDTGKIENLTKDAFADYAPTFSPDGKMVVYLARISGNEKLFKVDLATGKKTQLTFGTHDDAAAKFTDAETVIFPSTATDPNKAIEPEVARNGSIYNLWTLNVKTGELKQWTDALGGNFSPVILRDGKTTRTAFVSYYKGDYQLHMLDRKDPAMTANTADFGAPGPIIDFQAPLSHTLIAENAKRKGSWDKLFLEGRPPINVGVTSSGNFFGGTAVSFTDVLGDKRVDVYASSMSQYRTFAGSVINLEHRFQYALQGYWQDEFYYAQLAGQYYDPAYDPFIDRKYATSTRSNRGATAFGIYPFNRYSRIEVSAGIAYIKESYNDQGLANYSNQYQLDTFGKTLFRNGWYAPLTVALVQETTVFREFGPLSGRTIRASYEAAPPVTKGLSWQAVDGDVRKYFKIGSSGLLAFRAKGYKSWGATPSYTYFGGNGDMRGYDYLEFIGQNAFFGNLELRFPLIHAMATPVGILGGVRGVFFANMGGAWFAGSGYQFSTSAQQTVTPIVNYELDPATGGLLLDPVTGAPIPIYGNPTTITGFRLVDGRASYGVGLETFALGFPIHFDWSWRTLFNKQWEDLVFASTGGSAAFRKARFQFWIGYDF